MPILHKIPENTRRGNNSQLLLCGSITMIPKPDKDATKQKNNLMNTDAKTLKKIPGNQIQQYIKTIIKWNLFQGCKDGSTKHKSINVIHPNKIKNKSHKHLNKYGKSI